MIKYITKLLGLGNKENKSVTNSILRDFGNLDPRLWKHPVISRDSERFKEIGHCYGFYKIDDKGKLVDDTDRPFEDIYYYEHPRVNYKIGYWPSGLVLPDNYEYSFFTKRQLTQLYKNFKVVLSRQKRL